MPCTIAGGTNLVNPPASDFATKPLGGLAEFPDPADRLTA